MIEILVTNALLACPLAILAWAVSRRAKSPALAHAVWLIVLLKLVSPPMVELPFASPFAEPELIEAPTKIAAPPSALHFGEELALLAEIRGAEEAVATPVVEEAVPAESALPSLLAQIGTGLLWVWGLGSLAVGSLALVRMRRFGRLLGRGDPASRELRRKLRRLGRRIGMSRTPRICVVDARVSPMVWGVGPSTTLVLPSELDSILNRRELETLLLHELAHLKRRDHWVRLIELTAVILYWWNPVLWLCRRELRRREEECCDAWVVTTLPQESRDYARALVTCIDFVAGVPRPVAPGASAMGAAGLMKRRVEMILRPSTRAGLDPRLRAALVLLALVAIPVLPVFAQEESEPAEVRESKEVELARAAREYEKARYKSLKARATPSDDETKAVIALLTQAVDDLRAGEQSAHTRRSIRRLRQAINRLQSRKSNQPHEKQLELARRYERALRAQTGEDKAAAEEQLLAQDQLNRMQLELEEEILRRESDLARYQEQVALRTRRLEEMRRKIEQDRLRIAMERERMMSDINQRRRDLEERRRSLRRGDRARSEYRRREPRRARDSERRPRESVERSRRFMDQHRAELDEKRAQLEKEMKRLQDSIARQHAKKAPSPKEAAEALEGELQELLRRRTSLEGAAAKSRATRQRMRKEASAQLKALAAELKDIEAAQRLEEERKSKGARRGASRRHGKSKASRRGSRSNIRTAPAKKGDPRRRLETIEEDLEILEEQVERRKIKRSQKFLDALVEEPERVTEEPEKLEVITEELEVITEEPISTEKPAPSPKPKKKKLVRR